MAADQEVPVPPDNQTSGPVPNSCDEPLVNHDCEPLGDIASLVSEASAALQAAVDPINEFVTALKKHWSAAVAQLSDLAEDLQKVDWNSLQVQSDAGVLRLAAVGWTVPYWLTPRQVVELSKTDPPVADAWFTELYLGSEDALSRVAARLESCSRLAKWQPLVQQTCAAIRRREHLLAVPSLLLLIEGFVAQMADPAKLSQVRETSLRRLLNQVKPPERLHTTTVIWKSTAIFLMRLFGPSDFASDGPTFLNRHWILHGRCASDWSIADALRLLNALSTLDWLVVFEDRYASAS